MSKKFVMTDEMGRITLTHNMPFDPAEGYGKTEAELAREGFLLDEIPEPEQREGKIAVAYCTAEKGFWYEYEEKPWQNMTLVESVKAGIITPEQFKQISGIDYTA